MDILYKSFDGDHVNKKSSVFFPSLLICFETLRVFKKKSCLFEPVCNTIQRALKKTGHFVQVVKKIYGFVSTSPKIVSLRGTYT